MKTCHISPALKAATAIALYTVTSAVAIMTGLGLFIVAPFELKRHAWPYMLAGIALVVIGLLALAVFLEHTAKIAEWAAGATWHSVTMQMKTIARRIFRQAPRT